MYTYVYLPTLCNVIRMMEGIIMENFIIQKYDYKGEY